MLWCLSHSAASDAREIADRHYNRQKVGSTHFTPPGRQLVLLTVNKDALWVSSFPFKEYVRHAWAGAWMCTCFRNESKEKSSELNQQAVAATVFKWGHLGIPRVTSSIGDVAMVSLINRDKVRPIKVRGKEVWGYSWFKCGWLEIGETQGGLLALGYPSSEIPKPEKALIRRFDFAAHLRAIRSK